MHSSRSLGEFDNTQMQIEWVVYFPYRVPKRPLGTSQIQLVKYHFEVKTFHLQIKMECELQSCHFCLV